jgi:DMSO/TMAO reductase YedYZ molybdopterin-dependent catalytic subunit
MDSNSGPAASPAQSVLDARFKPVNGTRPELTPNDQFYRIDINAEPPIVDGTTWRLELGGLVGTPLSLALSEIQSMPSITQAVTMSCISNELGGDLIGTSLWTGVPFKDILAKAGLKPGVKAINISAADGFYESVPIEEAMDGHTMLVYQMGGAPLTPDHGYPLRIYIPNHFGMKQPKWITKMEAADSLGRGYWVDRGWSTTAYAQTTSVVDVVAVDELDQQTGMVPVGGIAWAGSRGISKVELKVDSGDWQSAELRNPPLSPLTWVQWRYFWKATPGYHTFSVRAYDGTGALQVTDSHPTFPDGATGIVEVAAQLPK